MLSNKITKSVHITLNQCEKKSRFNGEKENKMKLNIYLALIIKGFQNLHTRLDKAYNEHDDLIERGRALIGEYLSFGGGQECENKMGTTWWKNHHVKRIANKMPARQIFDETVKKFGKDLTKQTLSKVKYISADFSQFQETVIVAMDGSRGSKEYHRDDVEPWAELQALKKKAQAPCKIHGDGKCNCKKK